ncbi:MAG: hypothetical protein ACR2QC_03660 [Gammaproteobacteria bacterium]
MRFRLSPEWCILIRRLKVPPFRRKFILANAGTGISAPKAQNPASRRFPSSHSHPPSHSCEGRNLLAERRKLSPKAYKRTITRRFATAEIPAFAGMGLWGRADFRGESARFRRRRPKYTLAAIPAKAGISIGEKKCKKVAHSAPSGVKYRLNCRFGCPRLPGVLSDKISLEKGCGICKHLIRQFNARRGCRILYGERQCRKQSTPFFLFSPCFSERRDFPYRRTRRNAICALRRRREIRRKLRN